MDQTPQSTSQPLKYQYSIIKYTAMFLFVLLPFIGFYLGVQYEKNYTSTPTPDDRYYVGKGDECTRIMYTCPEQYERFHDKTGCGCKTLARSQQAPSPTPEESVLLNLQESWGPCQQGHICNQSTILQTDGTIVFEGEKTGTTILDYETLTTIKDTIRSSNILHKPCKDAIVLDYSATYTISLDGKTREITFPACEEEFRQIQELISLPSTALSPIPKQAEQYQQDGILVSVEYIGRLCPDGVCTSQEIILRNGQEKEIDDIVSTPINESILQALTTHIENADFEQIRSNRFTGTCPTAYDGQEVIYTFYTSDGVERIASCEVEIDENSPLFATLTNILNKKE